MLNLLLMACVGELLGYDLRESSTMSLYVVSDY